MPTEPATPLLSDADPSKAPVYYTLNEAEAWASGYNSAADEALAELQRVNALLEEARKALECDILDFDSMVSVSQDFRYPDKAFMRIKGTDAAACVPLVTTAFLREAFDIMQIAIRQHFLAKLPKP